MKKLIPFHIPIELSHKENRFIHKNIDSIFKSGILTNYLHTRDLEYKIKELYNVDYVIATSSCTMGIAICLQYIKPEYYIQVPMFTWWSILHILNIMKKSVAWNDVDLKTWLPIEQYTGASLYLNTFGNMGNSKVEKVIYDSSHCLGGKIEHFGLAHVFSLAPTKLVTSCEGGIIITNNKKLYEFALEYRNKIARMSEIHALIGSTYLGHLDKILKWKKKVHDYYKSNIPGQFQRIPYNSTHNTIAFLNVDNLKIPDWIEIKNYYEPIHDNGIKTNTKTIYENIICLPSFYNVDYKRIVEGILELNKL